VIGTKSGQLELYDLGSSSMLEAIDAHAGAVWAIDARPADRGGSGSRQIATGSADHDVKFWEVELKLDPEWSATQQRITLECARTLTMTEDVLAIKYSPDAKVRQRKSLSCLTDDHIHERQAERSGLRLHRSCLRCRCWTRRSRCSMRTRSSFSSRCATPPRASRAAFGNVDDTSFACIIRVAPRIALRRSAKSDADADTIYHGSELLATQTPQPASHPPCSDTNFSASAATDTSFP